MPGRSSTQEAKQTARHTPCASISVMIVGEASARQSIVDRLRDSGHPVIAGEPPSPKHEPRMVLLLCETTDDCCALADELHDRWPGARMIVASAHLTADLEEEAARRSFLTLRLQSDNPDEFHALVHDALVPTPPPTPYALKPRKTDHPPSRRH